MNDALFVRWRPTRKPLGLRPAETRGYGHVPNSSDLGHSEDRSRGMSPRHSRAAENLPMTLGRVPAQAGSAYHRHPNFINLAGK